MSRTATPSPSPEPIAANRTAESRRVSSRLVAMSSAAVLAVYAAGYVRTQTAADQLAADAAVRRPVMPAPAAAGQTPDVTVGDVPGTGVGPSADAARQVDGPTAARTTDTPTPAVGNEAPPAAAPHAPGASASTPPAVDRTAPAGVAALAPQPPAIVAATAATAAPVSTGATAAAASPVDTNVTPPAASAVPSATAASAAPALDASAPAPPAPPRYKDGTYTGWGTSRHGDIQARVVIENGRITSATIAQCLTRWPCSWIDPLPPQVVQRQSPETDFVSGATQSTNAFYYGVVQALGKASLP